MPDTLPPAESQRPIAIQCNLLSRRGGGLPSAILPVVARLNDNAVVVTNDSPEDRIRHDVITLPKLGWQTLGAGALRARKVGLIHTHGLWSGLSLSAMTWRRMTGGATIVSPHGMLDPWALRHGRVKKTLALSLVERAHMNGSAFVHALAPAEAEAIRSAGVTAPIAVIPNGVDPAPSAKPNVPDWMDRPTLLFLGRLHEKKGIEALIEAFAQASKHLPEWQLALAGWDDGPNDFREQAARTGAPIIFPGPLYDGDKAAAYAHAGAFVLPSHSEGLPMTVLEAWSHGKPVFMTDACNLPEGFSAGAAIRITPNPRDLAQVLMTHLNTPNVLENAGKAGHKLVAERFTWDAIAARFQSLYDSALSGSDLSEDIWDQEGQHRFA